MIRRVFRQKRGNETLKVVSFIAAVIVLLILINQLIGNVSASQQEQQLEIAQDAIMKAAVQCYALESQFPSSLDYLVENYGLTIDETKYVYHYRTIGSNMTPEIKVFPR